MIDYKNIDPRKSFKDTVVLSKLQQIKRGNPNVCYYGHRIDDNFDSQGIKLQEFLDKGYSFVYEEDESLSIVDDRDQKGKEKSKNIKPSPIVTTTKYGEVFIWLQISKEKWLKHREEEARKGMKDLTPKKQEGNNYSIMDPVEASAEQNTKQNND